MDRLLLDLRYALRSIVRRPLFTLVATGSLAIGIGANTAVFSVVQGLVLDTAPGVGQADRVVELGRTTSAGSGFDSWSYPDFLDVRASAQALSGAAAVRYETLSFTRGEGGLRVMTGAVSASYFDVLRVSMSRGRGFLADEDAAPGSGRSVVVSHAFWRDQLGGDPEAVGSTVELNRVPFEIVGVTAPDFDGHSIAELDLWVPITAASALGGVDEEAFGSRSWSWHSVVGRLAPDTELEGLNAQLAQIGDRLAASFPESNTDRSFRAVGLGPVPGAGQGAVKLFVAALAGLVLLVLLVTCANVAGMFLARATGRAREMAVRLSIGASRGAIIRQLTVEALVVFVLGGAFGVLLAVWGVGRFSPDALPIPIALDLDLTPDLGVLAAALGVTLLTGLLFGLLPALRATRFELVSALKDEATSATGSGRLRGLFVSAQVGFSLILLVAAGLFVRSLDRADAMRAGFEASDRYIAELDLSQEGYGTAAEVRRAQDELLELLRAAPGVEAAAFATDFPLDLSASHTLTVPEGWTDPERPGLGVDHAIVSPGYFETMDIPLLRGRGFQASDDVDAERVVIVSRTFAERAWGTGEALGKTLEWGRVEGGEAYRVVGVVEDVRNQTVNETLDPFVYRSTRQVEAPGATVVIHARGGLEGAAPLMRSTILDFDPRLALSRILPLEGLTALGTLPQRLAAGAATTLGGLALLLSGIGLYGVVAYLVGQRTREIGIRLALGAEPARVRRETLWQGMKLALPGIVLGVAAALAMAQLLRGLLLGLSPLDPVALGATAVVLLGVVAAATWIPARRAATVDPLRALRSE